MQKSVAVAGDGIVRVLRGEAEVQSLAAIGSGKAAKPGAEAVHQPRNAGQIGGAQHSEALRASGWFRLRHKFIVNRDVWITRVR